LPYEFSSIEIQQYAELKSALGKNIEAINLEILGSKLRGMEEL